MKTRKTVDVIMKLIDIYPDVIDGFLGVDSCLPFTCFRGIEYQYEIGIKKLYKLYPFYV